MTAPSQSKGERTRHHILQAAVEEFGARGFKASSVAAIARRADVSGSLAYAYFADKEALFHAALDLDAAAVISEGTSELLRLPLDDDSWRFNLALKLTEALDRHPLSKRVLAGLEPHVTAHMITLPALNDLRAAVASRIAADQARGAVRMGPDPESLASGIVTIWITILMAIVQFGTEGLEDQWPSVIEIFDLALGRTEPPHTQL